MPEPVGQSLFGDALLTARANLSVTTLHLGLIQDALVDPERNSVALAEALRRAGVPVVLKRYAALDHATTIGALAWPLRGLAPVLDDITAFVSDGSPVADAPLTQQARRDEQRRSQ